KAITDKVADNCDQALYLGELVKARPELELSTPVTLNICCFRYVAPDMTDTALNRINEEIVMDLQESGIAAPSTTKLQGKLAIRVNITNHRTTKADRDVLVDEVLKLGNGMTAD
ncbi:MAG: cytochrome D ubiquinol oxidase subunit I, partial [Rhodospirillaceae bacterium]|nr:cytochrome D ubiquinol oxidase subunit I [Rhodospirillaceae bacterium]